MGVYSPVPFATQDALDEIDRSILHPTFDGLKREGVMITPQGPKVIEYNVRFGDPETQSAMVLLSEDTDLAAVLLACTSGNLGQVNLSIRSGFACNVVVASQGYPWKYVTRVPITLQTYPKNVQVFHAGTFRDKNGCLRTGGGRVFSVAAWGGTLQEAVEAAYEGTKSVHFDGMFSRKDIASR
ncbi:Phosphoribosylamine--glycine ligase [Fusarium sp. LHS14.1]|nr:Phosphoribosylamine--glycine ligase [Fusarium sp. LHS14.1]